MAFPYATENQARKFAKEAVENIKLKTINNQSIKGDGNISISGGTTVVANPTLVGTEAVLSGLQVDQTKYKVKDISYTPFPTGDPAEHKGFNTTGTTEAFGKSVLTYENFKAGCSWKGELTCTNLPCGLTNVECVVTALTNSIALIELSSSNRAPFYWQYNTDSWNREEDDINWKYVAAFDGSKMPTSTGVFGVKCKSDGVSGKQDQFKYTFETTADTAPELSSTADNGTYVLKATKNGSTITYNWVKE